MSQTFRTYVIEQLGRIRPDIRHRAMFGGLGIYAGDAFFALIDEDVLYFKVDDLTRPAYEQRGAGPFRPAGPGGEAMQYYQVDEGLLEDPEALAPWVEDAVAVANRKKAKKRR